MSVPIPVPASGASILAASPADVVRTAGCAPVGAVSPACSVPACFVPACSVPACSVPAAGRVAAPLVATARILAELAESKPPGLVVEIGSIKAPVAGELAALRDAGVAVASIHPMFGPDVRLLAGRHVILVDIGAPGPLAAARALFEQTSAGLAEMSLEQHDRLVAWVLGLSHATNIAFFTALAGSGRGVAELAAFASTTFGAQLRVAARVAQENPELYFEIQSTNPHSGEPLRALSAAAAAVEQAVRSGDGAAFAALMRAGAHYLEEAAG